MPSPVLMSPHGPINTGHARPAASMTRIAHTPAHMPRPLPQGRGSQWRRTAPAHRISEVTTTSDLVSQRQACELLSAAGLARQQALLVLTCGLAGPSADVGRSKTYSRSAVMSLAERPPIALTELPSTDPRSLLVLREGRGTAKQAWSPAGVLARPWPLGWSARAWLRARIAADGSFPCLVTVAGIVVAAADVTGATCAAPTSTTAAQATLFTARTGAEWGAQLVGRRLPVGRGRAWLWWPPEVDDGPFTLMRRRSRMARKRPRPATRAG